MEWTWGWAGVLVAAVGAGVAVWQAASARSSRKASEFARDETLKLAKEANVLQLRSTRAHETVAEIERKRMSPAHWDGPIHLQGSRWAVTNTSGRVIVVDRFKSDPPVALPLISIMTSATDGRYDPFDRFELARVSLGGTKSVRLTILYHFDDDGTAWTVTFPL